MPKHEADSKKSGRLPKQAAPKKSLHAGKVRGGIRGNSFPPPGEERAFDITGQKEALGRIEESERKYRALYEGSRDGYAFTDMEGTILEFNTAFKEMLGYTEEELRRLTYLDLTPTKWHDLEAEILKNQVFSQGYSRVYEKEYRKKDGTVFPVSLRTYLAKDGLGNPLGMWAFVRDITEREQLLHSVEKARDELEVRVKERTRDLTKRLKELNCLCTVSGLLNQEEVSLEGSLQQAVEGIPPGWQFPEIACARVVVQDREFKTENFRETPWMQTSVILSQGRRVGILEVGYLEERPARDEGPFLNEERTLLDVLADQIGEFIEREKAHRALRETNELLEGAFSSIDLLIAYMDRHFNFIRVNRAYAEADGRPPEFYIGKNHFALFPSVENEAIFRRVVETGESFSVLEKPFAYAEHPERGIAYSDWSLHPVKEADGKVSGVVLSLVEVTQRKRAEHALGLERNKLRSILEAMPNGVYIANQNFEIEYLNPVLEKEFGPPEGRKCYEYFHDRREACPWCKGPEVFAGRTARWEWQDSKSGKMYELFDTPLRNADGTLSKLEFFHDITERKRAEEALRRSVLYTRSLIEASLDPLVTISPEGKITDVNRATEFATGVPREKLIGSGFSDYFTDPVEAREGYEQALRTGPVRDYPLAIRHVSGRVAEVLYNVSVYRGEAGEVRGVFATARDITQRKAAEQELLRLAAAVEQISEGILITDRDGKILYLNEAFETHHGLNRKEAMGSSYLDLLRAGMDDETKGTFLPEYAHGSKGWKGRLTKQPKEGRGGELEITITPVFGPSGEVSNYVAVERDLTQEVKLQDYLRQRQKMEALGTLAGGIAHDFNNILMPILINTEMALLDLKQEVLPSPHSLQLVREAANRGQELVKQIITYSRQKEQPRSPVEILPVVKEALKFLRATIPTNIGIRPSIGVESAVISADPTQIHQVLMNLCGNAAYAMREEGGVLEVDLAKVEVNPEMADRYQDLKPGTFLRLTVRDNGQGMTREVREKAFDPFFTTKRPSEGTGMGLAVVHGIVKTHEGAITLESEVGKGTAVQVFLPWVQAPQEGEIVAPGEISRGDERILLIDDEEVQVRSLQRMLERLGYRITGKTDPREALEAFRKEPDAFDLVITDQTMPELTGAQLAREFLRLRPDLPVILATGFSEIIDEEGARALGVRDFVLKPLNMRDLAERIRKALRKERS